MLFFPLVVTLVIDARSIFLFQRGQLAVLLLEMSISCIFISTMVKMLATPQFVLNKSALNFMVMFFG